MVRAIPALLVTGFLLVLLPVFGAAEEKVPGAGRLSTQQLETTTQMKVGPTTLGGGSNVKGTYDCACKGGEGNKTRCSTVRNNDTLECTAADTNACSGSCELTIVITGGNVLAPQ